MAVNCVSAVISVSWQALQTVQGWLLVLGASSSASDAPPAASAAPSPGAVPLSSATTAPTGAGEDATTVQRQASTSARAFLADPLGVAWPSPLPATVLTSTARHVLLRILTAVLLRMDAAFTGSGPVEVGVV